MVYDNIPVPGYTPITAYPLGYILVGRYNDCVPCYVTSRAAYWIYVDIALWSYDGIQSNHNGSNVGYSMTDSTG